MDIHAEDGNGGVEKEGGGGEKVMKKGPWTVAEDAMLVEYVKKHGEGNWNAVMRNSGLQRCGKSCRLRWANHLRPNLKKGAFSMDEERAIIQLHAKYGNKWARMASQLPGRTDNEIKNYWNTRLKRRQRAGLPVYPQEIQREAVEFKEEKHKQKHRQRREDRQNPHSTSATLSTFFPSSPTGHLVQNLAYNPHFALINPTKVSTAQTHPHSSLFRYPNGQPNFFASSTYTSDGLALPISSVSPVSCNASLSLYPSSFASQMFNQSFTSLLMPNNSNEYNSTNNTQFELPSFQPRDQSNVTPASSATSGGEAYANCPKTPPNTGENDCVVEPFFQEKCSGGLLDDMLKESQTICRNVKVDGDKGKDFMVEASGSDFGDLNGDSSSAHSSIGKKSMQEPMVELNLFEDDELSSILKTFGSTSNNGISSSMEGDNNNNNVVQLEATQEASPSPSTNVLDHQLTLGFCCWNNMPTISHH